MLTVITPCGKYEQGYRGKYRQMWMSSACALDELDISQCSSEILITPLAQCSPQALSLSNAFSSSRAPCKVRANVSGHLEAQAENSLSCFHFTWSNAAGLCSNILQFYNSLYVLENFLTLYIHWNNIQFFSFQNQPCEFAQNHILTKS